jgi:hypothetical protein
MRWRWHFALSHKRIITDNDSYISLSESSTCVIYTRSCSCKWNKILWLMRYQSVCGLSHWVQRTVLVGVRKAIPLPLVNRPLNPPLVVPWVCHNRSYLEYEKVWQTVMPTSGKFGPAMSLTLLIVFEEVSSHKTVFVFCMQCSYSCQNVCKVK